MNLPECVVCGEQCIPLADYDLATCFKCDDAMAHVLERAQFRIPAQPAWLPDVAGCGTPAGYLGHWHRNETPCDPCAHVWGVVQANLAMREQARQMKEYTDGLSGVRDADAAVESGTPAVVSALHGTRSRRVVRADPRPGNGAGAQVGEEEVPMGVVEDRQMTIFDALREQLDEAVQAASA